MNYQKRQQNKTRPTKWLTTAGIIVAVLLIGGVTWAMTHHGKGVTAGKPINNNTANSNTKGEPASNSITGGGDKTGGNPTPAPTVTLTAPQGNFVSNHHPNLGGTPAPNTEQSVCNTTPGAACEIIFTKDGVTKTLQAQATDSGGAAYWSWKLQDVGLTPGSWQVNAKASSGSQTLSTPDAMNLEVAP